MANLVMVAMAAVMVAMTSGASVKHHSMTISEEGAIFKQTTDVDVENRVVYIHVPGHRDLPESKLMYEFDTGRVLRCTPSIKRCYMSNFDTQSFPVPAEEEIDMNAFAERHHSPRTEEKLEVDVRQDMVVTERVKDISILSPLMKKAAGDFPIFREEPLPKDADIMEGSLDLNNKPEKRDYAGECRNGKEPKYRYARTTPSCNRMVYCPKPNKFESCYRSHYFGNDFYRCWCCKEHSSPYDCFGCFIM